MSRQPVQPDLFGDFDAAEERAAIRQAWTSSPQVCPLCGNTEPTGFLLNNNHMLNWGPFLEDQTLHTTECTAMYLTRNHVAFAAKAGAADQLARDLPRALHIWQHHRDRLAASLATYGVDLDHLMIGMAR